jgi:arylsulfatase A-like enzyme
MGNPHIVCIILDTLRYGHSEPMGYHRDTTPFLDAMAERGWRFSKLYANGPWTVPSHGSLFTGLDPTRNGANYPYLSLDPKVPTLAEVLRDAGYFSAAFSNNPWVGERTGLHRGFDHFDDTWRTRVPKSRLQTAWVGAKRLFLAADQGARLVQERLEEVLTARPKDKLLFLFINFMDVHPVCNPPFKYLWRFKGEYYHPHCVTGPIV